MPLDLRAFFMLTKICAGILLLGVLPPGQPDTPEPGCSHCPLRVPTEPGHINADSQWFADSVERSDHGKEQATEAC